MIRIRGFAVAKQIIRPQKHLIHEPQAPDSPSHEIVKPPRGFVEGTDPDAIDTGSPVYRPELETFDRV